MGKYLRIVPIDEDKIELRYRGFYGTENNSNRVKIVPIDEDKANTENNNNRVKRAVASLESAPKCIAAKPAGADHSNICIPGAAPITKEKPEPPKEKPEFPCHILYEVPDPDRVFNPYNIRKLKKYYLNRRSRMCNQLRLVYIVNPKPLKKMLKNGLTYSKV